MEGWATAAAYTAAALASAAAATVVALRLVHRHLLHYAEPTHQRFIVRIILMVPVYAVMSFLSLILPHNAIYFNSIREIDLLQPYNPVPKFIIIKSVVFLTYWQGVLVFLAAKSGFIKNAEKAAYLQNFVLCVEMLIAAIGHRFAFSYKEYAGSNARPFGGFRGSLLHAMKFNDFYHDTVHQFAPTYHEYVLYSNEEDEPTKYSPSTIVPTGEHIVELAEVTVVSSNAPAMSSLLRNEADQAETMPTQSMEVKTATSTEPYVFSNFHNIELSDYPAEAPANPDVGKR
ncbi:hypothetical protein BAE44_0007607 [Dichanthelium oligosanthes]|uniref:Uncharacterized protein n=1 Tax=Dichanthelium oligosanthes TaxID=888268 RepID=A0A1E5W1U1_9POAL|nr:hypothetical protein BAE44_0007607 [Dichanthelium oligosanthes]